MPDEQVTQDRIWRNAVTYDRMLPLSPENGPMSWMARDLTVYILHEGQYGEMVFDTAGILDAHGGLFGVAREEWEESPEFHDKLVMDRHGPPGGTGTGISLPEQGLLRHLSGEAH